MVCYDETNMETVDVFGENDTYLATLGKVTYVQKAKAEQTPEDLAEAARQRAIRRKTEENITKKNLEFEASLYDIDISGLPFEEALAEVMAARELQSGELVESFDERFGDELSTENAKETTRYYQDRLQIDR